MSTQTTQPGILKLNIKRVYLDQILSGEKTEEFRDATPRNVSIFCHTGPENAVYGLKDYNVIHFYVERNKDGFWADVAIKNIYVEEYLDPDTGGDMGIYYFGINLGEVLAVKP